MKRIFYIITTLFMCAGLQSQSYFNDFSALTLQSYTTTSSATQYTTAPAGFSLINDSHNNNIGSANNPNAPFHVPALKTTGWAVVANTNDNDTFLVSTSWFDTTTVNANRWIITPPVSIIGANTVLTWFAKSPDPNFPDGYEVYGTNKTGTLTNTDFTIGDRLFALPDGHTAGGGEKSSWTRHSVPLGAYAGQTLRFAFRNNSLNMFQLWIDDIAVINTTNALDGAINSLNVEKYILINTSHTVTASYQNLGASTINTVTLNYKYGTSSTASQTFVFANGLNYGEKAECIFPLPYSLSSPGSYPLKVWATLPNNAADQNLSNDTAFVNVSVLTASAPKKVLVEQFLSAMDGNSPDAQDKLMAFQSSSVIAVNIHENDTIGDNTNGFLINAYRKKLSTAMIDRTLDSSGLFPVTTQYYANRIAKHLATVTPASLSIVNKTYNSTTRQLDFTLQINFVGDGIGTYGADVYLVENNVTGPPNDTTLNGYNQVSNFYNVPWSPYYLKGYYSSIVNGWVLDPSKYKHQRVTQVHFGNFGLNSLLSSFTAGQTYTIGYSITLPLSNDGSSKFNADNMYIVGYLQENPPAYISKPQGILNVTEDKITSNPEVVGIKEIAADIKVSVYPNPTDGILFLNNLPENKTCELRVYDLLGKCVYTRIVKNAFSTEKIDVGEIPEGAYLLTISSEGRVYREKFVKQGN
ncbi:MAG: T9SS type A sorting domain-containing protein [Bacteroidetes bacterium]|nr:T9SS type A sorting domain-containing protein [Bacteroidota bacterium]